METDRQTDREEEDNKARMEAALRKSVHGGFTKEEKKADSSSSGDEGCSEEIAHKVGSRRREQDDDNKKDLTNGNQEDRLKLAKAEMDQVMEENQRLKTYLDRIIKDYRALQMQFHDIVQQENKPSGSSVTTHQETDQESEFVSLSLGRSLSTDLKKDDYSASKNSSKEKVDEEDKGGLALGLDCKFELPKITPVHNDPSPNPSPETSIEEVKEDAGETWPPQKGLKTTRTGDDEVSQQNPAKRARVSVRVRCDTPTMNDGCQWRKYGQKIAKGNPCPRAYYRCTVAPNCPVRKQVQRYAEDMSILITTYEGTHNHPLPVSATAMASTTSAAACMLMSGSSSSASGSSLSATANPSSANINGLNFYLSDNSKPKPFYLPNSSISSSHSFPTITLDLTNSSASSHLSKLGNFPPRYSSTNLSFSSLESGALPISWSNGILNYGNQPYNKNIPVGSLSFGRQPQETLYQSYLQKNILNSSQQSQLPQETIAAATKAITSDPSFQSALAAALTTIIGSASSSAATLGNQVAAAEKTSQHLKPSESFPVLSSFPSTSNANKCAPSFLNKPPSSTNSQPASLMFLSPSLPFSTSNSKSSSGDNRDHIS